MSEDDAAVSGSIKPDDESRAESVPVVRGDARRNPKTGRFGPGNCANPTGKKGRHLTGLLRELLGCIDPSTIKKRKPSVAAQTYAQVLVRKALKHAMSGNASFFREIFDRIDGKVADRILADLGPNWSVDYVTPEESPDDGGAPDEEL